MEDDRSPADGGRPGERRHEQRRRSLKAGRIIFGNLSITYDCTIRDLSTDGARLKLAANTPIPDEFHLLLTSDQSIGRAKVIWRRNDEIGIAFVETPQPVRQHPDPRIRRLAVG